MELLRASTALQERPMEMFPLAYLEVAEIYVLGRTLQLERVLRIRFLSQRMI